MAMTTIHEVIKYEVGDEVFDTEVEAIDYIERMEISSEVEKALNTIYYYNKYNLESVNQLIRILREAGLKIVKV